LVKSAAAKSDFGFGLGLRALPWRLQKLIGHQLAEDRLPNRPDLGKDVDSGACWDLGVNMSEIANTLVDDCTGSGTTVRACVKSGKNSADTLVDDGTGSGTTVRVCVKASNTLVDDGTGSGTTVRACVKAGNTLVDDGNGSGTTVRACVKAGNTLVDNGSGNGTTVRACVKGGKRKKSGYRPRHFGSCSTCKVVPRAPRSDMCNQCQTAVMVMLAFMQ
jgi:hypothetical protein